MEPIHRMAAFRGECGVSSVAPGGRSAVKCRLHVYDRQIITGDPISGRFLVTLPRQFYDPKRSQHCGVETSLTAQIRQTESNVGDDVSGDSGTLA